VLTQWRHWKQLQEAAKKPQLLAGTCSLLVLTVGILVGTAAVRRWRLKQMLCCARVLVQAMALWCVLCSCGPHTCCVGMTQQLLPSLIVRVNAQH
jgi:hypothetical protein